ncbi:MAG: ABC transporter ATP-binding protein [Candidatus Hydrogenedentes bacterium]|nr:ABC transporter ATP-binding protein [Candidatus Hydrogenedentota bacterium]
MPVLDVKDLKKGYVSPEGERHLVIDVPAFAMDDAEQVALQGSSGSGKTTFLNLIAGILQPDNGVISVAGECLTAQREAGRDRLRARHIGYVFQTFNLLQGYTALENVMLGMMFGRGTDTAYARALLERVGLRDRMTYRPRQLSVGQQQRVAVARALAGRPKLVLADEPTGNLDYHHAGEALKLVREICRENEAALLLVSHDRDILGQFERVQELSQINRAAGLPTGSEGEP